MSHQSHFKKGEPPTADEVAQIIADTNEQFGEHVEDGVVTAEALKDVLKPGVNPLGVPWSQGIGRRKVPVLRNPGRRAAATGAAVSVDEEAADAASAANARDAAFAARAYDEEAADARDAAARDEKPLADADEKLLADLKPYIENLVTLIQRDPAIIHHNEIEPLRAAFVAALFAPGGGWSDAGPRWSWGIMKKLRRSKNTRGGGPKAAWYADRRGQDRALHGMQRFGAGAARSGGKKSGKLRKRNTFKGGKRKRRRTRRKR
jgi:hypothetical protein